MALQLDKTVQFSGGVEATVSNAYAKIDSISGTKSEMLITLKYYKTSSDTEAFAGEGFTFAPSVADGSDNFIAQGYAHLKTLDAFSSAEDV